MRLPPKVLLVLSLLIPPTIALIELRIRCENSAQQSLQCKSLNWDIRDKDFKFSSSERNDMQSFRVENQTIVFIPRNLRLFYRLETLVFRNNQMKEIGKGRLTKLEKLRVLKITRNMLRSVPGGVFSDLRSLEMLSLRGNWIEQIAPDAFNSLAKLKILHLDENRLKTLDRGLLSNNPLLEHFTVATNFIKSLHVQTFRNNPKLIEVRFHANELKSLHGRVFERNKALERIDFSNNKLLFVGKSVLSGLDRLVEVDFEWNKCVNYNKSMNHNALVLSLEKQCGADLETKYEWLVQENDLLRDENEAMKKRIDGNQMEVSEDGVGDEKEKEEDVGAREEETLRIHIEYPEGYEPKKAETTTEAPTAVIDETTTITSTVTETGEPTGSMQTETTVAEISSEKPTTVTLQTPQSQPFEELSCEAMELKKEELLNQLNELSSASSDKKCIEEANNSEEETTSSLAITEDTTVTFASPEPKVDTKTASSGMCASAPIPYCEEHERCEDVGDGFNCVSL